MDKIVQKDERKYFKEVFKFGIHPHVYRIRRHVDDLRTEVTTLIEHCANGNLGVLRDKLTDIYKQMDDLYLVVDAHSSDLEEDKEPD